MSLIARTIGMTTIAACAVCGATCASAADLDAVPPAGLAPQADEAPVTLATGWYLRGDLGVAKDIQIAVGGITLPKSGSFPNSWSLGIGGGYKFNDWLRADVTLDWRAPRSFTGNTSAASCVTGWVLTGTLTETPITDLCHDLTRARITNLTGMFNLYADLGTWSGLTPYIGAGVGVNYVYQKVSQNWFMSNGVPYQVTTPDAVNTALTWYYNWDQARSASSYQFAWALMAGASYALTPNTAVDIGYRYLDLGKIVSMSSFSGATTQKNRAQEVRIGLRYTPD